MSPRGSAIALIIANEVFICQISRRECSKVSNFSLLSHGIMAYMTDLEAEEDDDLIVDEEPGIMALPEDDREKSAALEKDESVRCGRRVFKDGRHELCGAAVVKGTKRCHRHLPSTFKGDGVLENKQLQTFISKHLKVLKSEKNKIYDLQREIVTIKSLIDVLTRKVQSHIKKGDNGQMEMDKEALSAIRQLTLAVDVASKVAERIHKMEEGERLRLDITGLNNVVVQVVAIIQKHVKDPNILNVMATELSAIGGAGSMITLGGST